MVPTVLVTMTTSTCSISQVQLVQDTFKAGLNQSLTTITGLKITQAGFDAFIEVPLGLLPYGLQVR